MAREKRKPVSMMRFPASEAAPKQRQDKTQRDEENYIKPGVYEIGAHVAADIHKGDKVDVEVGVDIGQLRSSGHVIHSGQIEGQYQYPYFSEPETGGAR